MERSFVLVLTVVTLVTATPHGYGVKGGASAKAEASAVAGNFGDLGPIPLSIPSGAGYSGSFSKSSSSSFASSSASSSSSSYSFSGSGANGIAGIGNDKGCSSGTCSGIGSTAPTSNGALQFTGANAVSAAQAKALAGGFTPCQGTNCNGHQSEKCTSGQCPTATNGQNDCATGSCRPSSSTTHSGADSNGSSENQSKDKQNDDFDGSNDFAVNFNRKPDSKLSGDLNGQHSNKEKPYDSPSGCANGKCGSTNSFHSNLGNNYNKPPAPSTYLTTPKEKPPCTTPNCNYLLQENGYSQSGAPTSGLPSSYNVPIQSATNPPNSFYSAPTGSNKHNTYPNTANSGIAGGPCTTPNCNSAPSTFGTNVPNYHGGQQGSTNQGLCASGRCDHNGALPSAKAPNYSHGSIPSNAPSGQPGCKTPDCAELPTYSGSATYQPNSGCNGGACTGTSGPKPTDSGTPGYSSGYGGSAGFLNKNSGNSDFNHAQGVNGGCNGEACPGTSGTKPTDSGTPGYSGGYTGSAGFLSKNSGSSAFNHAQGVNGDCNGEACPSTSGNKPTDSGAPGYSNGYGGSPGFLNKNLGSSAFNHAQGVNGGYGSASSHGYKPQDLGSGSQSPTLLNPTGSFGLTPTGTYKTNELNSNHDSTQTSSNGGTTGVYGYNKQNSSPVVPGSHLGHSNTGSYGATPTLSAAPVGSTSHPHNSGVYKPASNNIGNNPNYSGNIDGSTQSSHSNSGSNSNHRLFEITKPNVPSNSGYTGSFGRATGSSGGSSGIFGSTGIHDKPSSGNCGLANCNIHPNGNGSGGTDEDKPKYTGGFGGPSGILKPNDYSVPSNTPTGSVGSSSCANGNCGPKSPSFSNPQNSISSAHNLAAASASATASANAVAYSGGFGGPPGVLKPYDDGKINNPPHGNPTGGHSPTSNSGNSDTSSLNSKSTDPSSSVTGLNAGALAKASASATAGSYGGGNNFENNGPSRGCNSGCGSNDGVDNNGGGAGSIASAKSSAGANAYGIGGSFASASAHATAGAGTKGGYGRK